MTTRYVICPVDYETGEIQTDDPVEFSRVDLDYLIRLLKDTTIGDRISFRVANWDAAKDPAEIPS